MADITDIGCEVIIAADDHYEMYSYDQENCERDSELVIRGEWGAFRENSCNIRALQTITENEKSSVGMPLPALKWGNASTVWHSMKRKELTYTKDRNVLRRHPQLNAGMRAILLDWLCEVCEVFKLHRETFHLCVDYIDRYLATQTNLAKSQLQQVGVTALFVAAKLEEIYPPKIVDFAYITDGACTEHDISMQELVLLKSLKWDLTPMTANMWMSVYLQALNNNKVSSDPKGETTLTTPLFSGHSFVQIARLLDLCLLDVGSLQFTNSQLAAAVLYHFSSEQSMFKASGYSWEDMASCIRWMAPFAITIRDCGMTHMRTFENIMYSDSHNIQTHEVDLAMLEKAQLLQKSMCNYSSPTRLSVPDTILTPPSSARRPRILRQ